jgi:hypothetical protein
MLPQQLNSYKDVQAFFNDFVSTNGIAIDDSPHGAFWNDLTYDQFVNGDIPSQPGVKILDSSNSADSNLIKILKGPLKVDGRNFRRMPGGGPTFMTDTMIDILANWIDHGCPNP